MEKKKKEDIPEKLEETLYLYAQKLKDMFCGYEVLSRSILMELKRDLLLAAFKDCYGNKSEAARLLKLKRTTYNALCDQLVFETLDRKVKY